MKRLHALVGKSMVYKKKSAISKIRFQEEHASKGIALQINVKTNHWPIAGTLIDKNNVRWYTNFDGIAYLFIRHVTDSIR